MDIDFSYDIYILYDRQNGRSFIDSLFGMGQFCNISQLFNLLSESVASKKCLFLCRELTLRFINKHLKFSGMSLNHQFPSILITANRLFSYFYICLFDSVIRSTVKRFSPLVIMTSFYNRNLFLCGA